jgi:hypothetical protein
MKISNPSSQSEARPVRVKPRVSLQPQESALKALVTGLCFSYPSRSKGRHAMMLRLRTLVAIRMDRVTAFFDDPAQMLAKLTKIWDCCDFASEVD